MISMKKIIIVTIRENKIESAIVKENIVKKMPTVLISIMGR